MSLRGRLLIVVVVLTFCGLVVADTATYVALRNFLTTQVDQGLADAVERMEHPDGLRRPGRGGPSPFEPSPREGQRIAAAGYFVQTRDASGDVEDTWVPSRGTGTIDEPVLPDPLPTPSGPVESVSLTVPSTVAGEADYRVRISSSAGGNNTIVLGIQLDDLQSTLHRLLAIELVVTGGVLALSAGVGLWLVRVGLRPLDDIAATAEEIAAGGDLTTRIERADDKTEVGRLGASLNEMMGQIESAFDERQRSEEALRASEERLRRFVADASHELRTPLAAVQAYAELFDRGAAEHPEDLPRLMQNIQKESSRMAVLVDDLLLLTRLDQRRPLDQKPVDLGALAADAVDAARVVDPDRVIQLRVDGSVEVRGDRVRLRQVIDNLLANVRVHTPAATPVEVDVTRHAEHGEEFGIVRVIDHGPGLTPEQQAKVFERFYRADPSRSRADGGSGLGLSIVAAIADAHGGAARVIDTPGGGATFEVAIPLLL